MWSLHFAGIQRLACRATLTSAELPVYVRVLCLFRTPCAKKRIGQVKQMAAVVLSTAQQKHGIFTARRCASAVYAVAICLSVCLAHSGIVSKRLNVGSRK